MNKMCKNCGKKDSCKWALKGTYHCDLWQIVEGEMKIMRFNNWLIINKNGIKAVRRQKPTLQYDEIAIKINLIIPEELFKRPTIEATLKLENIPNIGYDPELIINTKELIEQQTGAKIEFKVVNKEE